MIIPNNNSELYNKNSALNILHVYIIERVRSFEKQGLPCYISNEQLAESTGSSIKTISRAIKLLVEEKILWAGYHYQTENSQTTKQRVLRIFNSMSGECSSERALDEESESLRKHEDKVIIQNSTDEYIEKYLTVLEKDNIKKVRFNLNAFLNITNIDNDKVAEYIRQMKYKDFLLTPYWLMLSNYVKTKLHNNTCDECGAKTHLQTHHLTYDRHGYEHVKDVMENDLIVLCSKCHKKAHNIS